MNKVSSAGSLLQTAGALVDPSSRAGAAKALAQQVGAEELIVFVRDSAVGQSLPAPGFPQTLRDGRAIGDLVQRAIVDGTAENASATAIGVEDGTVAVLINGHPSAGDLAALGLLLPLLGALFRAEAIARTSEAESTIARQAAAEASGLAAKLDATRSDLQRALAVAEGASRARDEFLATVSHELRTPLTSVIGWVHLLLREQDPTLIAEGLETIDRNARAQSRLIEDILDFSRINAGKLRLDVQPIDVNTVIAAALDIVQPAAEAKGLRLDAVIDSRAGLISGDPDRLQQVIWNLLSNAVKFNSRGGRVQVRVERVNSYCEINVSDTGEGIAPEFLPYVFDRFSQADSTSTRKHSGLGLGLGIVRHLVELHGGTVQAFSPGLGKGATFSVRLPLLIAAEHDATHVPRRGELEAVAGNVRDQLADLRGISVLLVEDNDDARRLLVTILTRCGATVDDASGAAQAIQRWAAKRPDIIISDIEMPGEDGYSMIRRIRRDESSGQRVPAIALTAYARTIDRVRALAAGFQMHIGKPVEPAELAAAVKSLIATAHGKPGPDTPRPRF